MILVTTAGKVGSDASRLLGQQGVPVRVIGRNAEKAAALATEGVDVFTGDLEVPASVDAAMEGVTSVVLVTPRWSSRSSTSSTALSVPASSTW